MNPSSFTSEKREFVRVKVSLPVRYKFLSHEIEGTPEAMEIHEGTTNNLSGGGLLLKGRIPRLEWISGMLMEKIAVGVNLYLPKFDLPVKALTRVAWIEGLEEGSQKCHLGLRFKEIAGDGEDQILQFIIKCSMPGN
jgi:c-di-GMP-binding flagellar brake protein YcgR